MTAENRTEAPAFAWRGPFENTEVNTLHAECFDHAVTKDDWWDQVTRFSLGWLTMRISGALAGFVNVAWDGGVHAFLLDTMVTSSLRRKGYATLLVEEAVTHAKTSGCEWLHVDFDPELRDFYLDRCGFTPTEAGLIQLR
ncbi:GNAT family N-acetyltransferase [Ensifer sp. ZNC0028]|uniref:GNAT family N-acetyltransferase n=1 Tax=Ensifer sp. ZNC0028 TaxID=1339236 RepID=UPI0005B80770|nr:GNAT family N-acetyltransferase [Ensifer sp. ZNC0028]